VAAAFAAVTRFGPSLMTGLAGAALLLAAVVRTVRADPG
jgi:hypothetical protein